MIGVTEKAAQLDEFLTSHPRIGLVDNTGDMCIGKPSSRPLTVANNRSIAYFTIWRRGLACRGGASIWPPKGMQIKDFTVSVVFIIASTNYFSCDRYAVARKKTHFVTFGSQRNVKPYLVG